MLRIDLNELRDQFRGKPFSALIQHHLRKQSIEQVAMGIEGEKMTLSLREAKVAEQIIDYFNGFAYDKGFWRRDCASVLEECCWLVARDLEMGEQDVKLSGREASIYFAAGLVGRVPFPHKEKHEKLFQFFQLLVLNYAFMAHESKNFRKFARIRRSFLRI